MWKLWLLLFTVICSFAEAGIIIWLYNHLGTSYTLGIVIGSFVIGCCAQYLHFYIARPYLFTSKEEEDSLEFFISMVITLIFMGSVLLLLFPGILTDFLGVLLLVPQIRNPIIIRFAQRLFQARQEYIEKFGKPKERIQQQKNSNSFS